MRTAPSLLLVALLLPGLAAAVVISTGDGSGNTGAPPDDPGFANVGVSTNNLSGVYLGNGWVLTARHVGAVDGFTFDGVFYETLPGTRVILEKDGTPADLAMIRLSGPDPPLPDVVLASQPIAVSDAATLVGHGWSREATLTCWNATWSEVNCPAGTFEGYKRLGPRIVRWGRNEVTDVDVDLPGPGSEVTRTFETVFDEAGLADEAQIVSGDSGGGLFVKRGGVWELAGIHVAMGVFSGQPADTALFGNTSLMVDVHHYRPEIEALLLRAPKVPLVPAWAALLAGAALLGAAHRRLSRRR